jgi:hypothetical protein
MGAFPANRQTRPTRFREEMRGEGCEGEPWRFNLLSFFPTIALSRNKVSWTMNP